MVDRGLIIINHCIPCSCACKYCLLRSNKTSYGVSYTRGEKLAKRFNEWRKHKNFNDLSLIYSISHCADYPELYENITLNKSFEFTGYKYLQVNGIKFKTQSELTKFLMNAKNAGVTNINTTFYGLEEYHDSFSARKGDFKFLLNILNTANDVGLVPVPTFVITEENKKQIEELVYIIKSNINGDSFINGFIQDFRGNGDKLESVRLLQQSYESLPTDIKQIINISKHKTEEEWLKSNNFSQHLSRNLNLSLRPENIDMFEIMSCDEIINYLVELDAKFYTTIPDINTLADLYGNKNNQKLYRQRDLQWKWQRQFINDNDISIHDVTDERYCGSIRF